ncbi:MAG TPA: hypothetical protein VFM96_01480 [Gaiellaceae bacterium]|nr:hypothetical protein [Gaiellaceae bacterium]
MNFGNFFNDLIDGIKQQQNPFTTIRKAAADLGTKPLEDASDAVSNTGLPWLLGWIIAIPFLPVLAIAYGISKLVDLF